MIDTGRKHALKNPESNLKQLVRKTSRKTTKINEKAFVTNKRNKGCRFKIKRVRYKSQRNISQRKA
jgi:hypothetical protein